MSFGLVKHNNNSISAITSAGQLAQGKLTLIKEQTASSSASISFVDGSSSVVLDSTYPIYLFKLINIHPSASDGFFEINFSTDSGSNYNVAKTTTLFASFHFESGGAAALNYNTSHDSAQNTGGARIVTSQGNGSDESFSGEIFLYNPSSTTFVKHFMSRLSVHGSSSVLYDFYSAGYGNTTSAIDGVKFAYASGNIDSGTIKLYGIKGS
tara:strand:+ start:226 stop:855 length:630 start_codon:yes stop_codon:yes gene_type:complete